MSTKYVRVVPSSDGAGASLSSEIEHAFERIRERAYAIYDNRMADASNNEYENWLQAERELFEVPEIFVKDEGMSCRIHLEREFRRHSLLAERSHRISQIRIEPVTFEDISLAGVPQNDLANDHTSDQYAARR